MPEQTDNVDRYGGDACMVLMEEAGMGRHCCLSNITMYFYLLGLKDDGHTPREQIVLRDMRKAKWYLDRYMASDYGGPLTSAEFGALTTACEHGLAVTQRAFASADLPPTEITQAGVLAATLIARIEGLMPDDE